MCIKTWVGNVKYCFFCQQKMLVIYNRDKFKREYEEEKKYKFKYW